jgi:hypothetical protein
LRVIDMSRVQSIDIAWLPGHMISRRLGQQLSHIINGDYELKCCLAGTTY